MEQTITPEERARQWIRDYDEGEHFSVSEAYEAMVGLMTERDSVKQEALAQGWDECAEATKMYMVVELDPTIPESLKERNPHRSHA